MRTERKGGRDKEDEITVRGIKEQCMRLTDETTVENRDGQMR